MRLCPRLLALAPLLLLQLVQVGSDLLYPANTSALGHHHHHSLQQRTIDFSTLASYLSTKFN